jgi:hypothetical protein
MSIEIATSHGVRIHLDQHPYHSPNPTTGAALYQLGHVPAGYALFKEVNGNREDTQIPNDEHAIRVYQDDHFHSAERPDKTVHIVVNGALKDWHERKISYDEVVKLAFPDGPFGGDIRYSVAWTKSDGQEGSLRPGHSVNVTEGMQFDVANTDKS